MLYVPVVDWNGNPLMPTKPSRARKWVKSGEATPFWKNGVWCIRLNRKPSGHYKQKVAVGIDPGSKKEGFTVKSQSCTYLNVQADAHTTTKRKIKKRSELRRARRGRKCRRRKWRGNRLANKNRIPPSTMARWSWKVRIVDFLRSLYPINCCVVEDIAAKTKKGAKRWNQSFSPLEVGKKWFYQQMEERFWFFDTIKGYQTKELRDYYGLKKINQKLSSDFHAHCVDSWILATHAVGGSYPENKDVFCIAPIPIARRNLHREVPNKNGIRTRYGGTNCKGIKKGTLVKHIKYGLARIYGYMKKPTKKDLARILWSIQLKDGSRQQNIRRENFKILTKLQFQIV